MRDSRHKERGRQCKLLSCVGVGHRAFYGFQTWFDATLV